MPLATPTPRILWRIDQCLRALRRLGRRSVSILDIGCGDGSLLVRAAQRARELGFVAIIARGFDRSESEVMSARALAASERDPAIGLDFEVSHGIVPHPLGDEGEPDLVLVGADPELAGEAARFSLPAAWVIRHGWW